MNYLVYADLPQNGPFFRELSAYIRDLGEHISGRAPLAPKCTIARMPLKDVKEETLVEVLDSIAKKQQPFHVTCGALRRYAKSILAVELFSDELKGLHKLVIEALCKDLDHSKPKPPTGSLKNDPKRMEAFNRYGSVYVGDFYNPHLTLCYVKSTFDVGGLAPFEGKVFDVNVFNLAVRDDFFDDKGKPRKFWTPIYQFSLGSKS